MIGQLSATGSVVDLSLSLGEDLPCYWPGAVRYRHTTDHWFDDTEGRTPFRRWSGAPYHTCAIEIDEHTGTHFDAPAHFIAPPGSGLPNEGAAGALTAEKVALEQFLGPAAVIDVRHLLQVEVPAGHSPRIEVEDVGRHEAANGELAPGDVVLFRTGWDARYLPGEAGRGYVYDPLVLKSGPGWPARGPEAIALLLERGVRCVGTDGVSMGPVDDAVPTHLVGLGAGMVFVEALAGLDALPPRGAYFAFLPLKINGGSGGPGRALAIVPS